MKQLNKIIKILFITLVLIVTMNQLNAQSCCPTFEWQFNRVQCQTDDCKQNSAGGIPDAMVMCRWSTNRITVTPAVPGFTYTWTVTGGTINNTLLTTLTTTVNYIDVVWGGGTTGYVTVTIANAGNTCVQTLKQKFCLTAAPKPQFTINTADTVCINQPITFTSTTLGSYTNLIWNFGDGSTQTGGNIVTHSYTTAGTYTASLTATTVKDSMSCGCTNTFYYTIVVSNATGLSIYKPDCRRMHCAGDTVQYCASITGCSSYTWTANGGTVIGSGSCIRVAWNSLVANPTVTVTIPAACAGTCGNTATFYEKILFNGMPITANAIMCMGSSQTFILPSLPGVFYQWSVTPPAGVVVNGANINTPYFNATFNNPGTYIITCKYQDSVRGCSGTSSFTVQVRPPYNIVGSATSCETCSNTYATTPGGNFNWTISPSLPGFPVLNQPSVNITWSVGSANTYTLTATQVGSTYCNSPQIQNIIVAPKPVLTINSNINNICPGTPVKVWVTSNVTDVDIVWNTPGATILATLGNFRDTIVVVYNTCGSNTITATQDCKYNCTSTSVNITINPPPNPILTTPINVTPCIDQTVTYSVANCIAGVVYTWNISNNLGTIISGQGTCSITVLWHGNPGVGNAGVLSVSHCCGSTSVNINVTVPAILNVSFSGSLCPGTITATSNIATTSWSGTSTFSPSFGSTTTISSAGTICATATVGSCTQTKCYNILPCGSGGGGGTPAPCTKPNATFSVNYNPTCIDGVVTFTALVFGYQNYFWDFGDGNISYLPNTTTHQYNTTGLVTATLYVDDFGCKDTFSLTIDVQPKPIVTIAPTPVIICPGTGTTLTATVTPGANTMCSLYNYQWNKDGNLISGATGVTYTATSYGVYTVDVSSATTSCNCTMTSNQAIVSEYEKPKANITTSSTICFTPPTAYFNLTATAYAGYTYNWSSSISLSFTPNNSIFNSTSVTGTLTPNVPFQIYLEVVDSNGCKAYDTLCMYPFASPTVSIISTGTLCANRLNVLSVVSPNPNYNYIWNTGFVGTPYSTTTAGNYYTVATDMQSGCTAYSNIITISQTPFVELFPVGCDTMCSNQTLTIPLPQNPPLSAYTIQWYDGPKPAGTLLPYTGVTIPLSGLGLGAHQLWAIISFSGTCPDSTGVFNLFVKNCDTCGCGGSYWGVKKYQIPGAPPVNIVCDHEVQVGCSGITINASYICATTTCSGNVTGVLKDISGNIIATYGSFPITYTPTPGTTGTYTLTMYGWCGNHLCDSCKFSFIVNCPSSCTCDTAFHFTENPTVQEGEIIHNQFNAVGTPIKEPCGITQAGSLKCNTPYSFFINFTNPYTLPCKGYDSAVIVKNGTTVVATNNNCSPSNPLYYTFTSSGTYCIKHYLKVNGKTCDSCITCFTVTCSPVCDCKNVTILDNPTITWNVPKKGGGSVSYFIKGECNTSIAKELACGVNYNFSSLVQVSNGCPYTLVIELGLPGKPPLVTQTYNSVNGSLAYTFNTSGIYCVTFKVYINGVLCKTCTLCFKVCCYIIYPSEPPIYGVATGCKIGAATQLKHDSAGGNWYSNDTSIATVSLNSGFVTAKAAGITQIFYAYPKYPCGWHWIAIDYTVSLVDVPQQTTLSAPRVCIGSTIQATNNTPIPSGGSSTWMSLGSADVTQTGIITGKGVATTAVRYTITNALGCSNFIDKAFEVNAAPGVPRIGYAAGTTNPQGGAGGGFCLNKTFTVVGDPAGGVWNSSNTSRLTVSNTGICSTIGLGAVSLSYTVTNAAGCSSSKSISSNIVNCASRGVNNNIVATDNKVTIFPNPARNSIQLIVEKLSGEGQIIITDIYGKKVKAIPLYTTNNFIDISTLSSGLYILNVITTDGVATQKLIAN